MSIIIIIIIIIIIMVASELSIVYVAYSVCYVTHFVWQ